MAPQYHRSAQWCQQQYAKALKALVAAREGRDWSAHSIRGLRLAEMRRYVYRPPSRTWGWYGSSVRDPGQRLTPNEVAALVATRPDLPQPEQQYRLAA
jgi:hypothetical protein